MRILRVFCSEANFYVEEFCICKTNDRKITFLDSCNFNFKVCTAAFEHLIFSVPDGTQITDENEIKRLIWSSWTWYFFCFVLCLPTFFIALTPYF